MIFWDFVNNHPFIALLMLWAICDCIVKVVRCIMHENDEEENDNAGKDENL